MSNCSFLGLIHVLFPKAKIIHTKRNPIDTCLSAYTKLFKDDMPYSYDLGELGRYYRKHEELMAHWKYVLPPGVIKTVSYEEVVDDLPRMAREVIGFLDLPWNEACLNFHESSRPVKTASVVQVRKPVYGSSVERWRRHEKELQPLLKGSREWRGRGHDLRMMSGRAARAELNQELRENVKMNKLTVSLGVLAMVLAVATAAQAASATRIQKTFNNWRVDCAEVENKSRRCALQYSLVNKKNKQVVFSWSVIPKTKEATSPPQAVIRTPTGVALGDGISVVFAGSEPIKVQYKTCGARGCIAEVDFSDAWVKAFGTKPTVTVNYKAVSGTPIKHDLDLKNFQEAYAYYVQQMKTPI